MHLEIEHSDQYSFQNVYLKIVTQFPEGKRIQEQLSIDLAEKSGRWLGKCRGDKCRVKVFLLESFRFPEIGKYSFILAQHTREENLEGIHNIGLSVLRTD